MVKSNKWCLIRLQFDGEFYLNEGETSIGRNKVADVITPSGICSRNHCVITLDSDDSVHIKNQSSNGTYVNDQRIGDDPFELTHNDTIGLGCEQSIFDLVDAQNSERKNYYVFRLVDKSLKKCEDGDVIVLSDDEEKDTKPVIVNGQVKNENQQTNPVHKSTSKIPEPVPSTSTAAAIEIVPNEDAIDLSQDDNEIIYSQQVLMEIKNEVVCPDEIVAHEDDFSIYISDESCDGDSSSWAQRLSQNQDFVIKKVTESVQSKKRKMAKQIEAIALAPPEKARRRSTSAASVPKSTKNTKSTAIKTQQKDTETEKSASTSKSPKRDEENGHFVDRFDPFAKRPKTVEKSVSFEQALLQPPSFKPMKKRIAHVPKDPNKILSPILKKSGHGSNSGKRRKVDLRVRFSNEAPMIQEYEVDDDEYGEILMASPAKPQPIKSHSSNSFENDPLHEIITDITEWKPEWLSQRNVTPPINGINRIVCPLIGKYPSFDQYQQIVIPLLKHELWSSIQAEDRNKNRFEVKVNALDLVKRANRKRYVFHLQIAVESTNSKAHVGDFVIVQATGHPSFFAYVTNQRFTRSGYAKTTYLTMEASENVVHLKNNEVSLCLTPIANIRTELKLFNSIIYLDRTPFRGLILDPSSYKEPRVPNRIPEFQYTGYDKLNAEQMEILKSIINKTLDLSSSLSLIEGPPGTGKTRLIVSIILQMLFGHEMKHKLRILVLASSNAAVDIIAKRLLHIRDKMESADKKKMMTIVRFGVLNSMNEAVRRIAPQNLKDDQPLSPSKQCDSMKLMLDEQKRLKETIDILRKKKNAKNTVIQDQIKDAEKRLMQIKETIDRKGIETNDLDGIHGVMSNARIVCSTLSSSINLKQYIRYFDVCFIDEASQVTEPWSLVPLQYHIKSFILVGDSNQLSPVVLSPICRENSFERSLFTRLFNTISENGTITSSTYAMTTQYRMHPDICSFSNGYFYEKRLTSAPQTALANNNFTLHPYRVFNLKCLQSNQDLVSFYNLGEAEFIVTMLKVMCKHADPKLFSYGIITPYAEQRKRIQDAIRTSSSLNNYEFPVNTIDSYQGQEKDVIILCTTRTTGVGFLANPQRLNVALTRARKCLVICGNTTSISNIRVWRELLNDAKRREKYYDIPEKYNFKMIADLLIVKNQKTGPLNKPPNKQSTRK